MTARQIKIIITHERGTDGGDGRLHCVFFRFTLPESRVIFDVERVTLTVWTNLTSKVDTRDTFFCLNRKTVYSSGIILKDLITPLNVESWPFHGPFKMLQSATITQLCGQILLRLVKRIDGENEWPMAGVSLCLSDDLWQSIMSHTRTRHIQELHQ